MVTSGAVRLPETQGASERAARSANSQLSVILKAVRRRMESKSRLERSRRGPDYCLNLTGESRVRSPVVSTVPVLLKAEDRRRTTEFLLLLTCFDLLDHLGNAARHGAVGIEAQILLELLHGTERILLPQSD